MFDNLDVAGAQMVIDRVWFIVITAMALCIGLYLLVPYAVRKLKQFSKAMGETTNDYSGEDSDQEAIGAMDEETRRRWEKMGEMPGNRVMTGNSLPPSVKLETAVMHDSKSAEAKFRKALAESKAPSKERTSLIRKFLQKTFGQHTTIVVVEHENQVGKEEPKRGIVVGYRNQGLNGQTRVNYGHYSVWRDSSKLKKVSY